MALQSKMTVYLAIAGVFAMMGGIVYYASLDNGDLQQAQIELTEVELISDDSINDKIKLNVTFLVKNPSDTTFTVSVIEYDLYGDEELLGSGRYSTEDVSMPGRASFFPNTEIPLKNIFILNESDVSSEIFQSVLKNNIENFSVEGIITTQTTWTVNEKEFKSGF
jgi:hypothetical protein